VECVDRQLKNYGRLLFPPYPYTATDARRCRLTELGTIYECFGLQLGQPHAQLHKLIASIDLLFFICSVALESPDAHVQSAVFDILAALLWCLETFVNLANL
jgi:hypothetical protein